MKKILSIIFTVSATVLLATGSSDDFFTIKDNVIRIYPNPCYDVLNISIDNTEVKSIEISVSTSVQSIK